MRAVAFVVVAALASLCGCQKPVHFPAESMGDAALQSQALAAYDTDGDGLADFFTFADAETGRADRIGYDTGGDGRADHVTRLDELPPASCRHLVIILDGFSYDLVKAYYDEGGLRVFHAPSRVITGYPTMSDPCLEDTLGYIACRGIEAAYFDRRRNLVVGGAGEYMSGRSQPYNRLLDYRADLLWDAIGYVMPTEVFGKELNDAKRKFDRAETQEFIAYFVSSAGVGTRLGAEGQRQCLREVERLVHQVLWETHGLVKLTLMADHGHTYTPATRAPIESFLKDKGWRLRGSLSGPQDVVYAPFGLVTYAAFCTQRPAALAADMVQLDAVELASYADGETVVVLAPGGQRAVVRHRNGRFAYEPLEGDPLELKPVLDGMAGQADADGFFGADALLRATALHAYPASLERLWRAHVGLVENPPDVLCSLKDRSYSGAKGFAGTVPVASTHGSLRRTNSTTFIMSTIGPLPELMRSSDIPRQMSNLTGAPWPTNR
ncbi:MAG TPA: hypothetical protein PLP01_15225 [Phycisphaerae bacterium]|nr:hypothetical protein [Phycisphaerae bacterium]